MNEENNELKKLFRFEDKIFFVNLSDESWIAVLVNPDGTTESCENIDVDFWSLLTKGNIIGDSLPTPSEAKALYRSVQ